MGCALALLLGPVKAGLAVLPASRSIRADRKPDGPPGASARSPGTLASDLVDLGSYAVPASVDGTARGGVHAIALKVRQFDSAPLLQSMQQLLVQVTSRLNEHPKPFVLFFSSIQQGNERNLAAALIGIGLQHIKERVLIIEVAGRPRPTSYQMQAPRSRRPAVDPVTGLPTVLVDAAIMGDGGPIDNSAAVSHILAEQKGAFDFALVVGRPLSDPLYSSSLATSADLAIYALTPAQRVPGALWLRQRLAVTGLDRIATVVIEPDRSAAMPSSAANAGMRRTASARG
jgi:hypothetical protein